jgi:hypothetical protein
MEEYINMDYPIPYTSLHDIIHKVISALQSSVREKMELGKWANWKAVSGGCR